MKRGYLPFPDYAMPWIYALQKMPTKYLVTFVYKKSLGKAECLGRCELALRKPRHFVVSVEAGHGPFVERDTLVHEVAHAMAYGHADHGPAWGIAFARAYKAVEASKPYPGDSFIDVAALSRRLVRGALRG